MSSIRAQKISDFLKKEISLLISSEINDPRLKNINITAVKSSPDISQATVFYTLIRIDDKNVEEIDVKTLEKLSSSYFLVISMPNADTYGSIFLRFF